MNIEEARDYGLQCGAEEDGSIIGSAEHVLGGGMSGRYHGLSIQYQPTFTFDYVILISLYLYAAGI